MIESINKITDVKDLSNAISTEVGKIIIGNDKLIESLTISILSNGHVLLEGLPGTAKTLLATSFATAFGLKTNRVQSTPDMMPGDITGTRIYNAKTLEFDFIPGPIFANIVLVDEINRAPPRTQAALLEAMQENQVTVDGKTSILDDPFMVVATKNPIEIEGTFTLSPTQLDRFMFRLILDYPSKADELKVLSSKIGNVPEIEPAVSQSALVQAKKLLANVEVDNSVVSLIAKLVRRTRNLTNVSLGASPTASVALLNASKGYAAVVEGRDNVTVEDVKAIAFDTLNHRMIVKSDQYSSTSEEDPSDLSSIKTIINESIES